MKTKQYRFGMPSININKKQIPPLPLSVNTFCKTSAKKSKQFSWVILVKLLPDPRGAGLHEAFQFSYVRLHIRFQFYPTRPIYLGPPIFLQIPDLLCIDY